MASNYEIGKLKKKIHFIAIGGAAMHNLAISLKELGNTITGSDDEIFDPAKTNLQKHGILPEQCGWFPEKITYDIDAIILGMHARADNPELLKALQLGIKIYSFPEYIYKHSEKKKRIVVGGSHGKTTITGMLIHVMLNCGIKTDFLTGAAVAGMTKNVELSDDAEYIVIEGDEYLTSPIDLRPKFHVYKPDIAVISGIDYDHYNVFPTYESYVAQFEIFINTITKGGTLIYCNDDKHVCNVVNKSDVHINKIPYDVLDYFIDGETTLLKTRYGDIPLKIFGKHNILNISAAKSVCNAIGISDKDFFTHISTYAGSKNRLSVLKKNEDFIVFRDFAHAPSKVKATVNAVKQQFPQNILVACLELHTFSSLSVDFLPYYKGAMNEADVPIVYFNPKTVKHKKLPELSKEKVKEAFDNRCIKVFDNTQEMLYFLSKIDKKGKCFLFMSSGNFDDVDLFSLFLDADFR